MRNIAFSVATPLSQKWLSHLCAGVAWLGLVACGKQESPHAAVPAQPALKGAAPVSPKDMPQALSDEPPADKTAAPERDPQLDGAVENYKREHPFRDANELLKQEAFLKQLGPLLQEAVKNHAFSERVQKAVDFAAALKEGVAKPGSYRLDLKVDSYTPERTDRLLGAVLSGNPERLVKFVTSEPAVEFSYTDTPDRSSNGISVLPNPPPPPPK